MTSQSIVNTNNTCKEKTTFQPSIEGNIDGNHYNIMDNHHINLCIFRSFRQATIKSNKSFRHHIFIICIKKKERKKENTHKKKKKKLRESITCLQKKKKSCAKLFR